ncbi:SGNH/GDSL hydrolase family protein [Demequina sp. SYSU T00039]|uniref:SGNH/GDSL hydrolase family protein n=1 Tax=Demequina lignilytica TaxID=3051663 RepID=A0AAW7LZU7_9MICO|nr:MULTISPECIES: SGNH/GDSL hydrolase family protein [unclassified Demequina]MDN4478385.1 SGNH/GDSL hydrolase family protein [Demequina sp. SYSU T00039-1]MDN4487108.1 SGNH/GDSL hydrolase family protein [Demequina sp. SYSU T00039]MDN4489819.1 SGNH/GDSL hydrolase family protein [Demequina sp. SYSU T00068]
MRYVALGDSFTEGVGDPAPGGGLRGWADLVAAGLAAGRDEPVHYANLAIRGRLIDQIVDQQLPAALALEPAPTVMTFNGGGNDMMRAGWDTGHVVDLCLRVVAATADAGVSLIMLSGPDPTARLPRGRVFADRADAMMAALHDLGERHDHVTFVHNYGDAEMRRAAYWSPDRLHLNPLGHSRVAARVLTAMGVPTDLPRDDAPDPSAPGVLGEARYVATYVLPWLARRLTGRSSGDGREPKHPGWVEVPRASSL